MITTGNSQASNCCRTWCYGTINWNGIWWKSRTADSRSQIGSHRHAHACRLEINDDKSIEYWTQFIFEILRCCLPLWIPHPLPCVERLWTFNIKLKWTTTRFNEEWDTQVQQNRFCFDILIGNETALDFSVAHKGIVVTFGGLFNRAGKIAFVFTPTLTNLRFYDRGCEGPHQGIPRSSSRVQAHSVVVCITATTLVMTLCVSFRGVESIREMMLCLRT